MDEHLRPGQRGGHSEAAIAAALVRSGTRVSLPMYGSNGRIDLVDERDGALVRVQCKTACRVGDALRFWTCSNTDNRPESYEGQVDEFGVYSRDTGLVYLVPADVVPTRACFLRREAARNGQRAGVKWAADLELGAP